MHELVKSGDPVTGEQADIARWQDEAIALEADSKDLQETYRSHLP